MLLWMLISVQFIITVYVFLFLKCFLNDYLNIYSVDIPIIGISIMSFIGCITSILFMIAPSEKEFWRTFFTVNASIALFFRLLMIIQLFRLSDHPFQKSLKTYAAFCCISLIPFVYFIYIQIHFPVSTVYVILLESLYIPSYIILFKIYFDALKNLKTGKVIA